MSNFTTDAAGTANADQLPGAITNVFFGGTGASNFSNTVLGENFAINSLTFMGDALSSVGIDGNILAINATGANGNAPGNGIMVESGSGNHAINSNIVLGANQTWTVTDSGTNLTVSGAISGNSRTLTKAGNGALIMSASTGNTYTGGTTVSAGTLLANNSTGSATGSGAVMVNSGGTLGGTGAIDAGSNNIDINAGGNITGADNGTIGALTLTASSVTFSGTDISNLASYIVDLNSTDERPAGDHRQSGFERRVRPNRVSGARIDWSGKLRTGDLHRVVNRDVR